MTAMGYACTYAVVFPCMGVMPQQTRLSVFAEVVSPSTRGDEKNQYENR